MCGIFAVFSKKPISDAVYHGIIQLQHRGQDAAGIYLYDPKREKGYLHKDLGLVSDVVKTDPLLLPEASWGIGHVRYSTIGKGRIEDAQPLVSEGRHKIAMAHNGNVINYVPLRKELQESGSNFQGFCDLEIILKIFVDALVNKEISFDSICNGVKKVHSRVVGAYSVVAIIEGYGILAFRDPRGIRPLLYGVDRKKSAFFFASETNSLNVFGINDISDVGNGEVVFIDVIGREHRRVVTVSGKAHCSFEFNYFSKPNSIIDNMEIYKTRALLGQFLAAKIKKRGVEVESVIPVPTTARSSAIALARALGVNYEEGFVKQEYVGRTFIMPTQGIRQKAICRKLAPIRSVFQGRKIVLVDDSIVRGTVSKRVVKLAKDSEAAKVYFASTFPPITYPCLYGIDFPDKEQLIAACGCHESISNAIGADDLFYNDASDLRKAIGGDFICDACVSGIYPTKTSGQKEFRQLRQKDLSAMEKVCVR